MLSKYELSMFFLNFIIMKQVKSCKLIIKNIDLSVLIIDIKENFHLHLN